MNSHDALKALGEWSKALVVVQSGGLAVLGALIKAGQSGDHKFWLLITALGFILSILSAAHVMGAVPRLIQRLPESSEKPVDIYLLRNAWNIRLGVLATAQHLFFFGGLIAFGVHLYTR